MFIPMPFPKCPKCAKLGENGYHRKCGGALEINPDTNTVKCPKCDKKWDVWDSKYYCSCGNEFTSSEVHGAVEDMLMICKICIDNIAEQQQSQARRNKLAEDSVRSFIMGIFEHLGETVAFSATSVFQIIKHFLFG